MVLVQGGSGAIGCGRGVRARTAGADVTVRDESASSPCAESASSRRRVSVAMARGAHAPGS